MTSAKNQKNNNYISLMDATKFCNYSQEYLSLRARRGKLQSIKQGRNWVTTKEWLDEYIKKSEGYKEELAKKVREKEIFFKIKTVPFSLPDLDTENLPVINFDGRSFKTNNSFAPSNLPIENINFSNFNKRGSFISFLKIGFFLGTVFGILISALIFDRIYFSNLLNGASYAGDTFKDYFSWLGSEVGSKNFYGLANGLASFIKYLLKV